MIEWDDIVIKMEEILSEWEKVGLVLIIRLIFVMLFSFIWLKYIFFIFFLFFIVFFVVVGCIVYVIMFGKIFEIVLKWGVGILIFNEFVF